MATMNLPSKFLNPDFFANWKASGGEKPLITKRMVLKLLKMGLKRTYMSGPLWLNKVNGSRRSRR